MLVLLDISGVLQCVAACCSVLQCVAAHCSALQCVESRCSSVIDMQTHGYAYACPHLLHNVHTHVQTQSHVQAPVQEPGHQLWGWRRGRVALIAQVVS